MKSQGAQPQECEAKRRRLSEWAAGSSGPLGIAEDCVRLSCDNVGVCACTGQGEEKGAVRLRFGTLPDLGCSLAATQMRGKKDKKKY